MSIIGLSSKALRVSDDISNFNQTCLISVNKINVDNSLVYLNAFDVMSMKVNIMIHDARMNILRPTQMYLFFQRPY